MEQKDMTLIKDCKELVKGRCEKKGVLCGLKRTLDLSACKDTEVKKEKAAKGKPGPKPKKKKGKK